MYVRSPQSVCLTDFGWYKRFQSENLFTRVLLLFLFLASPQFTTCAVFIVFDFFCCFSLARSLVLFFFEWNYVRIFFIFALSILHTHNIETRNLIVYIYIMVFDVQVQWNSDFVAQINRRKKHFDYNWTINTCHSNWIFFIKF